MRRTDQLALVTTALMLSAPVHAQYQAVLLGPAGYNETFSTYARSGQQVGFGGGAATGGNTQALLWTGSASSVINLHPTGLYEPTMVPFSGSFLYGCGGGQQVGLVIAGLEDVATVWSGSAASAVYLHTPAMLNSRAVGTDGTNQVGSARVNDLVNGEVTHAFSWTGSAASAVDIHPAGFYESFASKVAGGKAAGTLVDDVGFYAGALWTALDPSSVVVLRPSNYLETVANDIRGSTVVGNGYPDGETNHALIWLNDGATLVDVHPAGAFSSFLYALNATHQVGLVSTPPDINGNSNERATVWAGSAASALDLHQFLTAVEPQYTDSVARGIDDDGSIYGYATIGGSEFMAVRWSPVAPCPLDLSGSDLIDADDIFAFLNLWFAAGPGNPCVTPPTGCPGDWNADGLITADDIFAFLNDWFAAGPGSPCP